VPIFSIQNHPISCHDGISITFILKKLVKKRVRRKKKKPMEKRARKKKKKLRKKRVRRKKKMMKRRH
jgi:hypothetical protein